MKNVKIKKNTKSKKEFTQKNINKEKRLTEANETKNLNARKQPTNVCDDWLNRQLIVFER